MKRVAIGGAVAGLLLLWGLGTLTGRTGSPAFPPPVIEIQRELQRAGYAPGPIDGQMGRRTRHALRAFQSAHGLKPTGELDAETWEALRRRGRSGEGAVAPGALTKMALLSAGFESESGIAGAAERPTHSLEAARPEEARAGVMEHRLRAPERIRRMQLALKAQGFDPGPIDGELGPQTEDALRKFQKARNLEPDGVVGAKTWMALTEEHL